jgi:flagellar biosynthesis protein FlhB
MSSAGEKTEKATPRRRSKAREEGQVSKSVDLNSAIMLSISFALMFYMGNGIMDAVKTIAVQDLSNPNIDHISLDAFIPFLLTHITTVCNIFLPLLLSLMVVGVLANLFQIGPLFTMKPLMPEPNKINPLSGFKRMFSMKGFVELIKGILKIGVIGLVGFVTIYNDLGHLLILPGMDIFTCCKIIFDIIVSISWKVCMVLLVIGIFDYVYQRFEFEKSIKMSKDEVKDEYKNIEGSPEIKRKIKSIQMQMAQRRMMTKVKTADVVVTNPTHYAVALKYDPLRAPAPIVVAKGADLVAKRIKEIAKEHKIQIVENKPLARSLFKLVDLDRMVPEELFVAVAEVLAYVYKKSKGKKKVGLIVK